MPKLWLKMSKDVMKKDQKKHKFLKVSVRISNEIRGLYRNNFTGFWTFFHAEFLGVFCCEMLYARLMRDFVVSVLHRSHYLTQRNGGTQFAFEYLFYSNWDEKKQFLYPSCNSFVHWAWLVTVQSWIIMLQFGFLHAHERKQFGF